MDKYHGFDQKFYDYLFDKIITDGGLRLQIIASDLANQLQKNYDAKDPLNLFRKQYGNIYQALKAIKNPFFKMDNAVIKMKNPDIIRGLKIRGDLMQKYEKKLKQNTEKQIEIMKINSQNKCSKCQKIYNINVNKPGSCSKSGKCQPLY